MKKRKTPDLEKYLEGKKRRFVNYTQGAKIYRMSYWPFVRLAKKAEAGDIDAINTLEERKNLRVELDLRKQLFGV